MIFSAQLMVTGIPVHLNDMAGDHHASRVLVRNKAPLGMPGLTSVFLGGSAVTAENGYELERHTEIRLVLIAGEPLWCVAEEGGNIPVDVLVGH